MDKYLENGSSQKKKVMDPIMMDDEKTKEVIRSVGVMRSEIPYHYKINSKKRDVAEQEGLDNY
jgi:hypothetical protein